MRILAVFAVDTHDDDTTVRDFEAAWGLAVRNLRRSMAPVGQLSLVALRGTLPGRSVTTELEQEIVRCLTK